MHDQERVHQAHSLQQIARAARAAGDGEACIKALSAAMRVVDPKHEALLHERLAWRLAKAAHDFGSPEQMLDAVTPLLGRAFEQDTASRQAAEPVTHRWWAERGYGDARIVTLWQDWAASWRAEGEPYMEAKGHIQGAWQLACSGDTDTLLPLIKRYLALTPKRFGRGSYRHPRASDCTASLPFVHLDLARTGLHAATWRRDERGAWHMMDALEEAMEETGSNRATDPWYLEPVLRGAAVFGWTEPHQWIGSYRVILDTLDHDRAPFHRALGRATLAQLQDQDPRPALQEALKATRPEHGPEWAVLTLLDLAKAEIVADEPIAAKRWLDDAAARITQFHVNAFDPALSALRARL